MILRRLGNKQAIAQDIIKYFPKHRIYVEPFFGAGGMFFNKQKVKYNFINDIDSDISNLFLVVMNSKEDLVNLFYKMPIHTDLLEYWKVNVETDPIKKAVRFLFLSNLTFMGSGQGMRFTTASSKDIVYKNLDATFDKIQGLQINNTCFRKFLKSYQLRSNTDAENTFIYCDPPYLGTNDNYSNSFTEQDSIDLFDCLQATGCKFAMSEFDNEFILNQAKERGLNVIIIGERKNLKNRRTEILITNYEKPMSLFD